MKNNSIYDELFSVEWDNCDMYSRLTLPALNGIITMCAGNHAVEQKIGYNHMRVNKQAWVLIRLSIDIKRFPIWKQVVSCRTWVESFNGILSQRNFELRVADELIGQASSIWSCINFEKRVPEQILADYLSENILKDKKISIDKVEKIKIPDVLEKIGEHKASFSDMDAMQHANNTKYTEWIFDCLPLEFIEKLNCGAEINYNYMSEVKLDEQVEILQGEDVFVIRKKGSQKPAFAFKLKLKK